MLEFLSILLPLLAGILAVTVLLVVFLFGPVFYLAFQGRDIAAGTSTARWYDVWVGRFVVVQWLLLIVVAPIMAIADLSNPNSSHMWLKAFMSRGRTH